MTYKAERRIYASADGSRILPEGSEEDAILLATKGQEFSDEDAKKLGLVENDLEPHELSLNRAEHLGGGGSFGHHTRPAFWGHDTSLESHTEDLRRVHSGLSQSTVDMMAAADMQTKKAYESQVETDKDMVEGALEKGRHSRVLGDEKRYPAEVGAAGGAVAPTVREGTNLAWDEHQKHKSENTQDEAKEEENSSEEDSEKAAE